jgi:hypothetical protein
MTGGTSVALFSRGSFSRRVALATLLSPLVVVPLVTVPTLLAGLYADIFGDGMHGGGEWLIGPFVAGYGLLIAYGATILYGLPLYLVLHRYGRVSWAVLATAGTLPVIWGGIILAVCGFAVATAFWAIATPLPEKQRRLNTRIALGATLAMLVLGVAQFLTAGVFQDELRLVRLQGKIARVAPKPVWWNEVVSPQTSVTTVEGARAAFKSLIEPAADGTKPGMMRRRQFFRLAYEALERAPDQGPLVVELVRLIEFSEVDYPDLLSLQRYAMALPLRYNADPNTVAAVLTTMLRTDPDQKSNTLSYARDQIEEQSHRTSPAALAPLCAEIAKRDIGLPPDEFPLRILRRCASVLEPYRDHWFVRPHIGFIQHQLTQAEANANASK